MRRIKIMLTGVVLLFSLLPTSADEGMWLLPLLEKMNIKSMQQLGCRLSADEIYNINNSLKDAVVVFGGGCTAEVVSDKGLILTNYHCGHSNIQKLSSVDHNYLQDGYWAMTLSEELPAEGLYVTFLESFTDVTDKVVKASKRAKTPEAADAAIKKVSAELSAAAKGNNQYLNANVVSMYGGNAYYLIVTKRFNDIRFVGAPPTSIGKFGADTDNWMWPRHTCDFSMFRIYADKNGNPAPYSPDNVPYTPKRSLEISLKGVAPGDFSMIIGYPGSTNRFMTSAELVETRDISNAISIQCRTIRQELLMEDMVADDAVRLQYAAKFNSSSNGWKKSRGMNETFGKLKVAERRAADEAAFTNWVNQKKSRKKAYGTALEKVNHAVTTRAAARKVNTYLTETLNRVELASIAYSTYTTMTENAKAGKMEAKGVEAMSKRLDNFYKDYSVETDRKVT
ncbi:MAG: S46 family peptidase, partial [Bacteroidales bacterium]|nr:S46 family peptidase [Bacteroidales bacterium]